MKAVKNFRRTETSRTEEDRRRATRLTPNHKSGKERRTLYSQLDDEEDALSDYREKRESALDFYDDEEDGER